MLMNRVNRHNKRMMKKAKMAWGFSLGTTRFFELKVLYKGLSCCSILVIFSLKETS